MSTQLLLGVTLLFSRLAATQAVNATTLTSVNCVDTAAFSTCYSYAETLAASCLKSVNGYEVGELACGCANQIDLMNCVISSCWNKVTNLPMTYIP
jgi:hypothetical protein